MRDRSATISKLRENREFRAAYIAAKLKVLIPAQIRALRLRSETNRQEDLASAAEMKQSRISAMETPGAVNFNLETLVRLASALKVGLEVKFVSFGEMLKWENEFSQDSFNPVALDRDSDFLGLNVPSAQDHSLESVKWFGGTYDQIQMGAASSVEDHAQSLAPDILRRYCPNFPPPPTATSGACYETRSLGTLGSAATATKQ